MPAYNFAKTAEASPVLEKTFRRLGVGVAGSLIGFGIGNYVTMETGVVEPTAKLFCNIGFESRCDVEKPEVKGSPLGTLGVTLLLGGLVTVVAGAKPEEDHSQKVN